MITLRELDPAARYDPPAPPPLDALVRAPAPAPSPPRRRRRRTTPRLALAGALAAAIAVAGVSPTLTAGPEDVVAAVTTALSAEDTVLHYTQRATTGDGARSSTAEVWQTAGGRRVRAVIDGGAIELTVDRDAGYQETYVRERNQSLRLTDPGVFRPSPTGSARFMDPVSPTLLAELPELLRRARRGGDTEVSDLGDATVRGTPVHRLRVDDAVQGAGGHHLIVAVDQEDFLPVRVERFGPGGRADGRVDYAGMERLPAAAAAEHLDPARHPGATRIEQP